MATQSLDTDTVLITGSNGDIGQAAVREFVEAGYRVVTVDREPGEQPGVAHHWTGDLLDPDTVDAVVADSGADAVVHLGTLPHPEGRPGHVTYRSNAMTTYNVLEAAAAHGVSRLSLASSINAMGACFQAVPTDVRYLPVDEDHPLTPRDPYAMGKRTIELQAAGFGRKLGDPQAVATFRFPWVGSRSELRAHVVEPDRTLAGIDVDSYATRDDLFAYLAQADAARALRRGIEANFDGHETFFATAADSNMETPTEVIVEEAYPDADAGDLSGTDALVDCSKARRVLDWEPRVSWRDLDPRDPAEPARARRGEIGE